MQYFSWTDFIKIFIIFISTLLTPLSLRFYVASLLYFFIASISDLELLYHALKALAQLLLAILVFQILIFYMMGILIDFHQLIGGTRDARMYNELDLFVFRALNV